MVRRGFKHSPETLARLKEAMRSRSAEISEQTKARIADPAVRRRIREGMKAASREALEVLALKGAWLAARPAARKRFLAETDRRRTDWRGEAKLGRVNARDRAP
jgi:hypothetical protein